MPRDPFKEFERRMTLRAKVVANNAERVVRRAALAADTALVQVTPVDTGRARGNWVPSIGSPAEFALPQTEIPSAAETLADGVRTIGAWKLGMGPIFISNSVPYIIPLEEGHSQQAPAGMTKAAIQAAKAEVARAKLLDKKFK